MSNYPSLEICYELSINSLKELIARRDALDNKILAFLGFSITLITFVPTLARTWLENPFQFKNVFFASAIICFISAVIFLLKAYWPEEMIFSLDPEALLNDFANMQPQEARILLLKYFKQYYDDNYAILDNITINFKTGVIFSIIEASFLFVRFLLS